MVKEQFAQRVRMRNLLDDFSKDKRGFLVAVQDFALGNYQGEHRCTLPKLETIIVEVMARADSDHFNTALALDLLAASALMTPKMREYAKGARRDLRDRNRPADEFFCNPDIQFCLYVAVERAAREKNETPLFYAMNRFCAERRAYLHNTKDATPFMEEIWKFDNDLRRVDPVLHKLYKERFEVHILDDFQRGYSSQRGFQRLNREI